MPAARRLSSYPVAPVSPGLAADRQRAVPAAAAAEPSRLPSGTYLMRVRIDGAESRLQVDLNQNSPTYLQYVGPTLDRAMNETATDRRPGRWKRLNREHLDGRDSRGCACCCIGARCGCAGAGRTRRSQDYMAWRISRCPGRLAAEGEDRVGRSRIPTRDAGRRGARPGARRRRGAHRRPWRRLRGPARRRRSTCCAPVRIDRFERDVFLLALAPELDASFERLYAYVQDDLTRRHATPQLALTLLATRQETADARDYFLPEATLTALPAGRARRRSSDAGLRQSAVARRRTAAQLSCSASIVRRAAGLRAGAGCRRADRIRRSRAGRAHRRLGAAPGG